MYLYIYCEWSIRDECQPLKKISDEENSLAPASPSLLPEKTVEARRGREKDGTPPSE
jgi:hypothetical protein